MGGEDLMKVECKECHYSKVVDKTEETPAEYIIEHGRETGHKLTASTIEEENSQ